jgi:hypothetical protein
MIKKRVPAILSLLLCGVVLLAGCTSNGNRSGSDSTNVQSGSFGQRGEPGASGLFVQSIISPKTDVEARFFGLYEQEDGSLLLTGWDETLVPMAYTGESGGTDDANIIWEQLENPAAIQYLAEQREAGRFPEYTVGSDGVWWATISDTPTFMPGASPPDPDAPKIAPQLVKLAANGEPQSFDATPSGASSDDYYTFLDIQPGPNGTVYALLSESFNYSKNCWVAFDGATGKEMAKVELNPQNHSASDTVVKGSTIYVPNVQNNQIEVYSMLDGSMTDSFTIPQLNFGMESICLDIAGNGDFCYADSGGIHRIAQEGTLVQDMVNDTRFIFAAPEFWGSGLIASEDGSYILLASDSNSPDAVYRYVFDETATVSAENSLSVWALADSHVLRAAISEYSNQYPDVYVSVEYGRTDEATGATDADIIRTLNTRLLAGDVPDVLILDGLPTSAYIQRGMLTDLSGLVDTSGLYENIMQAYEQDGKVYGYPALFQMPLFMASADDERAGGFDTLSDLAAIAEEDGTLHYGNYEEMFQSLYAAYSRQIFPGEASVDESALRAFLESTKTISASLGLTSEIEYRHGGVSNPNMMPRQGLHSYIDTSSRYCADILSEPVNVSGIYDFNGAQSFTPLPGGAYIPVCGAAIPAGAANTEKATAFIELMLQSDTVQDLHMEQGFSVKIGQHLAYYESTTERSGLPEEQNPANYDWDGLITSFTGPAISERTLYLELYGQAERLYRGELTLDEVVGTVIQNTRLYFEERA